MPSFFTLQPPTTGEKVVETINDMVKKDDAYAQCMERLCNRIKKEVDLFCKAQPDVQLDVSLMAVALLERFQADIQTTQGSGKQVLSDRALTLLWFNPMGPAISRGILELLARQAKKVFDYAGNKDAIKEIIRNVCLDKENYVTHSNNRKLGQ